jgi:NADPH2:quinone reductase
VRAAIFTDPGPATVLHLVERPIPPVGPGEVRVRVAVSGVNPTDVGARAGRGTTDGTDGPHVPGQDGAGMVDALGPGVSGLRPGDPVWMWDCAWQRSEGTCQEYVTLPRRHVVRLPDGVPLETGAALGIPALTAHRSLTAAAEGPRLLGPGTLDGRVVLVTGGAGAVGNAAIQLAVWSGATVLTTVDSPEKAALAKAAGAQHVLNYREEDAAARLVELAGRHADLIVEVNAGANLPVDVAAIASHGTVAIYTAGRGTLHVPALACMLKNVQLQFILTYGTTPEQKDAAIAAVTEAVAARALRIGADAGLPIIRFPLDQVVEAHQAVERHVVGKVLVDIARLTSSAAGEPRPV